MARGKVESHTITGHGRENGRYNVALSVASISTDRSNCLWIFVLCIQPTGTSVLQSSRTSKIRLISFEGGKDRFSFTIRLQSQAMAATKWRLQIHA